jgi:hypothetical protein
MSLQFVYVPPHNPIREDRQETGDEDEKQDDFLEIRTPHGHSRIGELANVTPNDQGSEMIEGLMALAEAFKRNKDNRGGIHIYNGGLDWRFSAKTQHFQCSTSLFLCETTIEYSFDDEKERQSAANQIQKVLETLVPLVRAKAPQIRAKNMAQMAEELEETKNQTRIHLRVPHRKHPRGILDEIPSTASMSDLSKEHFEKLEEVCKESFASNNQKRKRHKPTQKKGSMSQ